MDLKELTGKVETLAKKAGAFIRQEQKSFKLDKVEHKGFNDLVSYVDKYAEEIIVTELSSILPEAGFITEEGTRNDRDGRYTWIVDPLDGTTNFVHGVPVYSVSIALQDEEEMLLGVVYEINLDECFSAYRGGGSTCNGNPIQVSAPKFLAESLIATGFPYDDGGKIDQYLGLLKYLIQNSHGLRRLGSAAVDLCYVASGRIEGYLEYNLKPYDVAAGIIIVHEAGGNVTDFRGGNDYIFGGEILATNGPIHKELESVISTKFRSFK
ncbi:MAG: inositol monophosphatase family protein [Cyclobacteriaceae bacterium]